MTQSEIPPKHRTNMLWPALFGVLLVALVFIVKRSLRWGDESNLEFGNFQYDEPPKSDPAPDTSYVSKFEAEARLRGGTAGPGLAGFVPEAGGRLRAPGTGQEPSSAQPDKPGGAARQPGYDPEREREAIRRLDPTIRSEQTRLHAMTARYSKRYPIVREVDKYFFGLPRYKALYEKYQKDRNLFSFFREAVTLPEVRSGVKKYMLNGEAMKVGVMMLAEGLTQPVPKPVMQETFTFINQDKAMSQYMSRDFWPQFTGALPGALVSADVPPGGQAAIQGMTSALSGTLMQPTVPERTTPKK